MRALLLIMSISVLFPSSIVSQVLSLESAAKQRLIRYTIHGNATGVHYIRPLLLDVENISSSDVNIKVENGRVLAATDPSFQDFVITKQEILSLEPGAKKEVPLYAMCLESYDASPDDVTYYHPSVIADSALLGLCRKIEKDKMYGYEAQTAVWALACHGPIDRIVGFDTLVTRQLTRYVADATGQSIPPDPSPDDYERNYYSTCTYKLTMGGEFSYNLFETRSIIIAMFDKDNIAVRELYKNTTESPGDHNLKFEFDATTYTDDYYLVRVIDNGDIAIELKVDIPKRL